MVTSREAMSTRQRSVLNGISAGNFHLDGGMRAAKLDVLGWLPFGGLAEEMRDMMEGNPPSIVKEGEHGTGWTKPKGLVRQWSLFNSHGDTSDTSDDFNYNTECAKASLPGYRILGEMIDSLPDLVNMRLNVISPGAELSPHEEHLPLELPNGEVFLRARFHLPLWTNSDCLMMADGELHHFEEGSVYFFNNGCVHGAANSGTQDRAHLVWDMRMTSRALDLMFPEGPPSGNMPVRVMEVGDWIPSGGMGVDEFLGRKLVLHP